MPANQRRMAGIWIALTLGLVTSWGAVQADENAKARAEFNACLAHSTDRAGDKACLYVVSDSCSAQVAESTTNSDVACLVVATEAWDGVLNEAWPRVRDKAKQADAEDKGANGANLAGLLTAQRAWITYRDAECAYAYQRFSGGTIRSVMAASCQFEITAGRAMEFRDWLRDGN